MASTPESSNQHWAKEECWVATRLNVDCSGLELVEGLAEDDAVGECGTEGGAAMRDADAQDVSQPLGRLAAQGSQPGAISEAAAHCGRWLLAAAAGGAHEGGAAGIVDVSRKLVVLIGWLVVCFLRANHAAESWNRTC